MTPIARAEGRMLEPTLASSLLDALPCSVIVTDAEGRIEWVNRGFSEMCGYGHQEVLGKKPGHFLQGPATDPVTVKRISQALSERLVSSERILNYDKRGRAYWVSLDIAPIKTEEHTGFIAVTRDLTVGFNSSHEEGKRTMPRLSHLTEAVAHLAQAANEEVELHQFCLSLADALASLKRA